jgi:hypothetical protein
VKLSHEEIHRILSEGCPEERLSEILCPLCGGPLSFAVNPNGRTFFVRCKIDSGHLSMHGESPNPPSWWSTHVRHGSWTR